MNGDTPIACLLCRWPIPHETTQQMKEKRPSTGSRIIRATPAHTVLKLSAQTLYQSRGNTDAAGSYRY